MNPVYGPFLPRKIAREKGSKFYFTGKPCKRGHITHRMTSCTQCTGCAKQRYAENREFFKARSLKNHFENRDARLERFKKYREENPERKKESDRNWRLNNLERKKQTDRSWRQNNREHCNAVVRKQYRTNPQRKVAVTLRNCLNRYIGAKNVTNRESSKKLIGCSVTYLMSHLENQFEPGMTWENHGQYGWHIDHIRPCASFDLTDPEQQKQCFHYTNLQPLWAEDNLKKNDRWSPDADC